MAYCAEEFLGKSLGQDLLLPEAEVKGCTYLCWYSKAADKLVCHSQAAVRMHACRSLFRRQQGAAVLVQSGFRRMQHRSRFLQVQFCPKIIPG